MGQYKTGTVSINANCTTVTGTGTLWSDYVGIGYIFKVKGNNVTYTISAVDTDTYLHLSAAYAGGTVTNSQYQIITDFTSELDLTEIWAGDSDWPWHLTEGVIRKLDKYLSGQLTLPTITMLNADATKVDAENIKVEKTIYYDEEYDNGNSGGSITVDWTLGNKQKLTLTEAPCTITFTPPAGPTNLQLKLVQDGSGSKTVNWPGTCKWKAATAPVLTVTASAVDFISFYYDGTNYYGIDSLDMR